MYPDLDLELEDPLLIREGKKNTTLLFPIFETLLKKIKFMLRVQWSPLIVITFNVINQ
jgi:hypothetical protein